MVDGLFVETTDQKGQQSSDAESLIVVSLTWGWTTGRSGPCESPGKTLQCFVK